jgi:GntR family transcriptional regulator/MocR family aminotransferase
MRGVILDQYQDLLGPVPNMGVPELRRAVAAELKRERGMDVSPEQIVIGAGTEYFYSLIVQLLGRERIYALEEPGHRKIARAYLANGARVVPIGMDEEGLRPDELEKSGASVVHLSPSHHYPTGIVTPIGRRQALMRWLSAEPDRYAVEDDYDSEFRFTGRPIPTMQSMDATGRLLYLNTFSRTIAPALRISYLILPRSMLPMWREKLGFYSCAVPSFEQLTLTRFLSEGYFDRHVSRLKKHSREVRAQLLAALRASALSSRCTVLDAGAGLHFLVQIHTDRTQEELQAILSSAGLRLPFLSSFYLGEPTPESRRCVVVDYADADPDALAAALSRIVPDTGLPQTR